jgi:hypothetical protein
LSGSSLRRLQGMSRCMVLESLGRKHGRKLRTCD